MKIIHKSTVKKIIREGHTFKGYIAPSNVNSFHINGGWHIGMKVEFNDLEVMEQTIKEFAWYNCVPELGMRVRFWID